jgi:hypothetical protein
MKNLQMYCGIVSVAGAAKPAAEVTLRWHHILAIMVSRFRNFGIGHGALGGGRVSELELFPLASSNLFPFSANTA